MAAPVSQLEVISVDDIESRVARDVTRKAAIVVGPVALALGIWRGGDAALGVVLALALIVTNLLLSAALLGWTARSMPHALTGVALFSFLGRLVFITVVGAGIKALDVTDWPVFCVTLLVAYFGLLFWELRSISLSLASPGLKPKPGQL
jgi:hypothetical protein